MVNHLQPDLDTPIIVNGSLCRQTEAQVAVVQPRVNGTGSITIAGTDVAGDVITLTFTSKIFSGGTKTVAVTDVTGDTNTALTERLAAAINNDALLNSFDVVASEDPVVAGKCNIVWPGPLGSYVTLSALSTGAETFTYSQIAGGSGPIIPIDDYQFVNNGAVVRLKNNRRVQLDSLTLAALVAGGPQPLSKTNPSVVTFPCL